MDNKILEKINGETFLIKSYSNIGVFIFEKNVYLIDTGSNESLAAKVGKYLFENFPDYEFVVVHTHCHVDHIKGNEKLKNRLNANFFAPIEELSLGIYPEFEGIYLFGAPAPKFLKGSFFMAKGVIMNSLEELAFPLEMLKLPGHSPGHTVFITPDEVVFLGDLVFGKDIIEKYKYIYIMDVDKHLNSLEKAKNLRGSFFVPSHGKMMNREEFLKTLEENIEFVKRQLDFFYNVLKTPLNIDEITGEFLTKINFTGNEGMYFLARSYVSAVVKYFYDRNMLVADLTSKGLTFSLRN